MRSFIVLCLAAVAIAAPQYSYDQQSTGNVGAGSDAPQTSQPAAPAPAPAAPAVYNKQFYIHSAPEDALDDASGSSGSVSNQKSLRVVIVKSPENKGLENAALQLAKSAGDQQTAIYVLNRQTDLGDLQQKLSQLSDSNANKPEVHFVKYKTPEEAEHAQHSIQAQYDSLPGPSSVSDEGVAPVQSFVGSAPSAGPVGGAAAGSNQGQAAYLPPQFRRFVI